MTTVETPVTSNEVFPVEKYDAMCSDLYKALKKNAGSGKNKNTELEEVAKKVKSLAAIYKNSIKAAKKKKRVKRTQGEEKPIIVDNVIVDFFKNAKFKNLNPVKDLPLIIKSGVTTSSTLTRLFIMYVKDNDLQSKENGQRIHSNDLIKKYFGETLKNIKEKRIAENKDPAIDQNEFCYWTIQSILSSHKQLVDVATLCSKLNMTEENLMKQIKEETNTINDARETGSETAVSNQKNATPDAKKEPKKKKAKTTSS